jgi:dTDP-4-dehydrorhamnose 3,5-epimerase
VVQGKAWDVAVDIRPESKTYGQWVGVELSGENSKQFWIPEGFAHGFIALEDNTQFLYKATNYYNKESEDAIIWNDADLGIDWHVDSGVEILVSAKDEEASQFSRI